MVNKSVRLAAELAASNLTVNQTHRGECPKCGRNTFTVTRLANSIVWNCYRNSCDLKPGGTDSAALAEHRVQVKTALRPYRGKIAPLEQEDILYFWERFDLRLQKYNSVRVAECGRYLFDIIGPDDRTRGHILRDPQWSGIEPPRKVHGGAKAMTYWHQLGPKQSFHGEHCPTYVLVEDHLSAIKVQQVGLTGVALLGTDLNHDKVREIAGRQPKNVLIALDSDATEKAFKLARKWGLAFRNTRVVVLDEDLKDSPRADIHHILGVSK